MGSLKPFVIIGAGGHGQDLLSIYKAIPQPCYEFIGFLDDTKTGPDIIGKVGDLATIQGINYIIGINSSSIRRFIDNLISRDIPPIVLIHPSAIVGSNIQIGPGVVLAANTVLTTNVKIGRHTHLNVAATVSQGSIVGDYVTLSPGVHIAGDVNIGHGVSMGAGAVAINLVSVGEDTIVGAGAVIVNDIPPHITVVGVPAKRLL